MKAIVYYEYGGSEALQLKEVPTPTPKDNEVLIKIHATSVNSWDWDLLNGTPFLVRLVGGGISKPKINILGCDVAGTVEAIGKKVIQFKVGDDVFGDLSGGNWGGFAEYVCAQEKELTLKPKGITFEQAASLPQAAVMALQGIRDHGKVQSGHKVLINGAGGGIGSFAIQMAKEAGAEITGVDSAQKFNFMRSLGANHVIDYKQGDFTKNGKQYDFILDVVGYHSIFEYKKALTPTGIYRMIGGPTPLIFQSVFVAPFITMFHKKKMGILAQETNKELAYLAELVEKGKLNTNIHKVFPLSQTADALQYLGDGKALGKIVISI